MNAVPRRHSTILALILSVAAAAVAAILIWQGLTEQGAPDPMRPNTSPTVAFLDIGVLVFREGLECILVLAAITASIMSTTMITTAIASSTRVKLAVR